MRKIIVDREMIKYWRYLHREAKWTPKKPYCKMCSCLDRRITFKHGQRIRKYKVNYFEEGEEVIRVDLPNDTFGLYHVACWNDPKNKWKVDNLLERDVDRFDKTQLEAFISPLLKNGVPNAQIVRKVAERFKCSQRTAYRKIKAVKSLFP